VRRGAAVADLNESALQLIQFLSWSANVNFALRANEMGIKTQ
jgi:hypothetical protein